MTNPWVEFVKKFAKKNGESYGCAISNPQTKIEYYKQKERNSKMTRTPEDEMGEMGASDVNAIVKPKPKKKKLVITEVAPPVVKKSSASKKKLVIKEVVKKSLALPDEIGKLIQDFARPKVETNSAEYYAKRFGGFSGEVYERMSKVPILNEKQTAKRLFKDELRTAERGTSEEKVRKKISNFSKDEIKRKYNQMQTSHFFDKLEEIKTEIEQELKAKEKADYEASMAVAYQRHYDITGVEKYKDGESTISYYRGYTSRGIIGDEDKYEETIFGDTIYQKLRNKWYIIGEVDNFGLPAPFDEKIAVPKFRFFNRKEQDITDTAKNVRPI